MADVFLVFHREWISEFLLRWGHVVAGVVWIGLLYYFNFVQVPAFNELDAGARNQAVDKLASRALWWFRWGAMATLGFGILILAVGKEYQQASYWKSYEGIAISTGMLLAVTMFANVWLVIWPNQKKVIANARNVLAGGEADPDAPAAGRKALLASRQNAIFSFTMLFFMVGTAHFMGQAFTGEPKGGARAIYWIITIVLWAALEVKALGVGGAKPGGLNWMYDDHKRAIGVGLALVVVWYVLFVVIL
ncbi:MAG: urate hydroxylase PuuD [Actinomycetes bacterium]